MYIYRVRFISHILLIHSLGLLSSFGYCENAAMNREHSDLFEALLSIPLDIYPEVELLDNILNFLRNCHTIFHSGYTIL